jgi:hypothetical protein
VSGAAAAPVRWRLGRWSIVVFRVVVFGLSLDFEKEGGALRFCDLLKTVIGDE